MMSLTPGEWWVSFAENSAKRLPSALLRLKACVGIMPHVDRPPSISQTIGPSAINVWDVDVAGSNPVTYVSSTTLLLFFHRPPVPVQKAHGSKNGSSFNAVKSPARHLSAFRAAPSAFRRLLPMAYTHNHSFCHFLCVKSIGRGKPNIRSNYEPLAAFRNAL
jgi:hypothetical protein